MVLPVTYVLAFGECQKLCGFPERDMRHPELLQRCYTAVSLAGAWLVAQSKATPSEYHKEVDGEFGHISGPPPISQGSSPAPQNKPRPCVEMGPGASSRLTAGQPGAGDSLSVWQHLSPCAGAPSISIFLKPPGVIPPGGSTTICCSCQRDRGNFVLYKDGRQLRTLELRGSRAEFSISNVTQKDRGAYSCHYLDGGIVLARSETVEVMVQEFHLPKPVLSVLPGHEVAAGAHVIFRCTIAHSISACFLYLEGQVKVLDVLSKERDYFNISRVYEGNGGRYSCQCFTRNTSFKWSAVSNTLDLVVRDEL
ncbi:hypothetical protein QYF61_015046 [Mycteria americana]|uniref:Ig-like domain-containing protein n=1 Tax=Mycteria americana TaxID=33587 RepID=A0AAN7MT38_MYCAM|nr:hypothetical protein QYF61_015046 [Mycteria americana]